MMSPPQGIGIEELVEFIRQSSLSDYYNETTEGKAIPPTCNMFEYFSKSFLEIITRLDGFQGADFHKFQQTFQKFSSHTLSRFHTSVEEKVTIDSYRNKIFQREEKARKDLSSLEKTLQHDRDNRAKAFARYQAAEAHLLHEEHLLKEEAREAEVQLENEFGTLEEEESEYFTEEESSLVTRCGELKTILKQLQLENRIAELSQRDKKEQSVEEVTNLLREYNADIREREEQLKKLQDDYDNIKVKLDVYKSYFKEKERKELQRREEERLRLEAEMARQKQREDAAIFIQFCYRRHRRRKKAKEGPEKKGKGKKGKGKKGKSRSPSPSGKKKKK